MLLQAGILKGKYVCLCIVCVCASICLVSCICSMYDVKCADVWCKV